VKWPTLSVRIIWGTETSDLLETIVHGARVQVQVVAVFSVYKRARVIYQRIPLCEETVIAVRGTQRGEADETPSIDIGHDSSLLSPILGRILNDA
jgi:hypothetical protein